MRGLIPALAGRGFVANFFRKEVVMTSPDLSVPITVFIVPSNIDMNDVVHVFLEDKKMATFYRQPDETILALIDHLSSQNDEREDDQ